MGRVVVEVVDKAIVEDFDTTLLLHPDQLTLDHDELTEKLTLSDGCKSSTSSWQNSLYRKMAFDLRCPSEIIIKL